MPKKAEFEAMRIELEARKKLINDVFYDITAWVDGFDLGEQAVAEIAAEKEIAVEGLGKSNEGLDTLIEIATTRREECQAYMNKINEWWDTTPVEERSWRDREMPEQPYVEADWD